MKQTLTILVTFVIALIIAGCNGKTGNKQGEQMDSVINMVNDTALYGVIGEGTSMHMLELQLCSTSRAWLPSRTALIFNIRRIICRRPCHAYIQRECRRCKERLPFG